MNNNLREILTKYNIPIKKITILSNAKIIDDKIVVKERKKDDIDKTYSYLKSRSFDYFPEPITINDQYELYPYINNSYEPKEQKAMDLIYLLSLLHNKTTFYREVDIDHNKEIYENTINTLDYLNNYYTGMTIYDETFKNIHTIYLQEELKNTLGEVISNNGLKQLRIAETEKYAHVTFFFNGGVETKYLNEDRILVNSPKEVKTYDLKPEMSAYEVKDKLINELNKNYYDLIILNFANPDMVGHTGNLKATIKAIEAVDDCMKSVLEAVLENDYTMIVTADHGNSECMINEDGSINTAHTNNLVPLALVNYKDVKLNFGKLSDIAPTILKIMEIDKPVEMTGNSLID